MKKILIALAASTLLSTSVLAAEGFYGKVAGGANKMLNKSVTVNDVKRRFKSKVTGLGDLAVGYQIMDNVRSELKYSHVFSPKFHNSSNVNNIGTRTSVRGQVDTLTVNGYVDLFDVSAVNAFIGGGIGMARVKEKSKINTTANGQTNSLSNSSKAGYNFAYEATAGISAEVSEGVVAELAYSFRDAGRAKAKKGQSKSKQRYQGNNLTAGLRFGY